MLRGRQVKQPKRFRVEVRLNQGAAVFIAAACSFGVVTSSFGIEVIDYRDKLDRIVAEPDYVDVDMRVGRFAPFVADDVVYDGNVYRLPPYITDLSTLTGIGPRPSRADEINTVSAGLDAEWLPGNRQTIDVDIDVGDNRYEHNSNLNDVSTMDTVSWNWGLGSGLSGEVGADYSRLLAGFTNTETYSKTLIEQTSYYASTRYQIGPRWGLFAGVLDTRYLFTTTDTEFNNSNKKSVELGANYLTSAETKLGFDYRYTDARYPNSILLGGATSNLDYREDRARVLFSYTISDKTLLEASAGYVKRRYPNEAIGGFSGDVGRLSFQWQPTPKTQFIVNGFQELNAELTDQSDYFVSRGANVNPAWAPSEKITVSLILAREYRKYEGSIPEGVAALPIVTTALSPRRRDTLTTELAKLLYTPTQAITLTFSAGYETRESNIAVWHYNDARADAGIKFKF
jgi:hypothetical protein